MDEPVSLEGRWRKHYEQLVKSGEIADRIPAADYHRMKDEWINSKIASNHVRKSYPRPVRSEDQSINQLISLSDVFDNPDILFAKGGRWLTGEAIKKIEEKRKHTLEQKGVEPDPDKIKLDRTKNNNKFTRENNESTRENGL